MTTPKKEKPEYSQQLLLRLIRETKDYQDLVRLTTLYIDLEEAGDIALTKRIILEIQVQSEYFKLNQ